MEATLRHKSDNIEEKLARLAYLQAHLTEYDFYQTIRHLNSIAEDIGAQLTFKSDPSTAFAQSAISRIDYTLTQNSVNEIVVYLNVLRFVGGQSMLPDHYTELVLERRAKKDKTLGDFLDIFIQGTTDLYYNTWRKTHTIQPISQPACKGITGLMTALLGKLPSQLRDGQLHDTRELFYAGLFTRHVRPREALQTILSDYFNLPVSINNYSGQWIRIPKNERSQLPKTMNETSYNQLGVNVYIGRRYWDTTRYFDIEIGPVSRKNFNRLLPCQPLLKQLKQLTQQYVGDQYRSRIYIKLDADAMQGCQLRSLKNKPMQLGWNAWLSKKKHLSQRICLGEIPLCCVNPPKLMSKTPN